MTLLKSLLSEELHTAELIGFTIEEKNPLVDRVRVCCVH